MVLLILNQIITHYVITTAYDKCLPLSNGNSMASASRLHSNQFNSSGKVYMVYLYGLPQRKGKKYCNISARIELQHKWNGIRENRWILLPLYTGIKHAAIQSSPGPIKLKRHWWLEKKYTSLCHARQLERQKFQQQFLIEIHAGKEKGNSDENWFPLTRCALK